MLVGSIGERRGDLVVVQRLGESGLGAGEQQVQVDALGPSVEDGHDVLEQQLLEGVGQGSNQYQIHYLVAHCDHHAVLFFAILDSFVL